MKNQVTTEQQIEWSTYWRERSQQLQAEGHPLAEPVSWFGNPNAIGYDQGNARPGELGKWDIFYTLCMYLNDMSQTNEQAAQAVGLELDDIISEQTNDFALNPDDAYDQWLISILTGEDPE